MGTFWRIVAPLVGFGALAGCVKNPPPVECTGSVVTTVQSNTCEAGRWDIPIDVKVDGQLVGSIGVDRAPFGPFKYSSRQRQIELWAGRRQLDNDTLRCKVGEHREFGFELRHIGGVPTYAGGRLPCEGRACLTSEYETSTDHVCYTAPSLELRAITTTTKPTETCNATVRKVVQENSCAPGLWKVPIEVRLSGHVIGSMPPDQTTLGPFPYAEPDPWVELWVGKRRVAAHWAMSCHDGQPLTLELTAWHRQVVLPSPESVDCEGAECLDSAKVTRRGTYCSSTFDLSPADLNEER